MNKILLASLAFSTIFSLNIQKQHTSESAPLPGANGGGINPNSQPKPQAVKKDSNPPVQNDSAKKDKNEPAAPKEQDLKPGNAPVKGNPFSQNKDTRATCFNAPCYTPDWPCKVDGKNGCWETLMYAVPTNSGRHAKFLGWQCKVTNLPCLD